MIVSAVHAKSIANNGVTSGGVFVTAKLTLSEGTGSLSGSATTSSSEDGELEARIILYYYDPISNQNRSSTRSSYTSDDYAEASYSA